MIEGVTIAQLAGDAQGICNADFSDVLLAAVLFVGGMGIPLMIYGYADSAAVLAAAAGKAGAKRPLWLEDHLSPAEKAKLKIRRAKARRLQSAMETRYGDRSVIETPAGDYERPGPIERAQNAYARGQVTELEFERRLEQALCEEEGFDESLRRLNQDEDDTDTEETQ